jgi:predicted AlkP superfamily pyrophosphatase or phosphodiesterase
MLLLISLDGMSPSFYLDPSRRTPTLKSLARLGVHAKRLIPIYPSVTFTNHVTMVTGLRTSEHGVFGNTIFCEEDPLKENWALEARHTRAPALWEAAEAHGLRCALIRWPVTVGARASWVIPEVFTWELTRSQMDPDLARDLMENTEVPLCGEHSEFDRWSVEVTRYLLRNRRVDLILLHLVALDHIQHRFGPRAEEVERELALADSRIAEVLADLDLARDQIMVVGDHGFQEFTGRVNLNGLFHRKGWLRYENGRITDWKVSAHQNCGQAAVYCRDPTLRSDVIRVLQENSPGLFQVVERGKLDHLGAFPQAHCAVDCLPGYSIGQDIAGGNLVTKLVRIRGEHGYLPDQPAMHGGWLAAGSGITPGREFEELRMEEIAGISANWLGIPFGQRRILPREYSSSPGAS